MTVRNPQGAVPTTSPNHRPPATNHTQHVRSTGTDLISPSLNYCGPLTNLS